MYKPAIIVLLCFLVGVFGLQAQPNEPIVIPPLPQAGASTQDDGLIRVIIGLNLPTYQPEGELPFNRRQIQRQQISAAQMQLFGLLPIQGEDDAAQANITTYSTIPYVAVTVDAATLQQLMNSPLVSTLEENIIMYPQLDVSVPLIGGAALYASGYNGAGQAVAILDTGTDANHPMLQGRITHEACFSTNSFWPPYSSTCPNGQETQLGPGAARSCFATNCFHGSHVAGIVAGDNGVVRGVAPNASIVSVQVFSEISISSLCGGLPSCVGSNTEDMLAGLDFVHQLKQNQGVNIVAVNLSLGSAQRYPGTCEAQSPSMTTMLQTLRAANIAPIIATGNAGYADGLSFPACLPGAVSVGASDNDDQVTDFSNGSPTLDLLAPGEFIYSAITPGTNPNDPNALYARASGTSMASPHVAGAWALIRQAVPNASVDEVLMALQATGKPITDPRNRVVTARIQIDEAIMLLQNGPPPRHRVVLNEIRVQGAPAIELYNKGNSAANLIGWYVETYGASNTLETRYNFPAGFTLPVNGYAVLYYGTGTNTANTLYMGNYATNWGAGGAAQLHNGFLAIDFVRWGTSNILPGVGTGWGGLNIAAPPPEQTLGRDRNSKDTDYSKDWFPNDPTLGAQNQTDPPLGTDPDDFDTAKLVDSLPYYDEMDTFAATAAPDDPDPVCYNPPILIGERINRTVWYRYTPDEDRRVVFATAGSDYGTILSIWTGTRGNLTLVACNDDVSGFPLYNDPTSIIDMNVQAGVTYHIMVSAGAFLGQSGTQLVFTAQDSTLINDDFADAKPITLNYQDQMNVIGATVESTDPKPPCYTASFGAPSINDTVWYRYTPPRDQRVNFNTHGSGYGNIMSIWRGQPGSFVSVACHSSGWTWLDDSSSPNTEIEVNLSAGVAYHIMISSGGFLRTGQGGEAGNLILRAVDKSPPNLPPVLTRPPDQTHAEGETVSLQIMATDPNNDILAYAAQGLPQGLNINPQTGLISGTLTYLSAGVHQVTVTVIESDLTQLQDTTTFTWTVTNTNRAPVITSPGHQYNNVNTVVNLPIIATDADHDTLTYSATGLPPGLQIAPDSGVISGTLGASTGTYNVTITVTDNGEPPKSAQASFVWTILGEGETPPPPTATDEPTPTDDDTATPVPTVEITPEPTQDMTPPPTDDESTGLPPDVVWLDGTPGATPVILGHSNGKPIYMWSAVEGVSNYEFFLSGPNFAILPFGNPNSPNIKDQYVYETLSAAQVCQGQTCSFDPTTVSAIAWLPNGNYEAWLCKGNTDCTAGENWRGPFGFRVNVPVPTPPTQTGASTTQLTWELTGNAVNTGWFQVYLAPNSDIFNPVIFAWYSRAQVCGSWQATTCTWTLPTPLTAGTEYTLYVLSWSPGGFPTDGIQGWAGPVEFTP